MNKPSELDEILKSIYLDASTKHKIQQKQPEWIEFLKLLYNTWYNHSLTLPINILEIGSFDGGTAYSCHSLFTRLMPEQPFTITCIDIQKTYGMSLLREKNNIRFYQGSSHDMTMFNTVNDRKYNLLFIDGDHSAEGSLGDFFMYNQLLVDGEALVAFHDIIDSQFHRSHKCTVYRAWEWLTKSEEVKTHYPQFVKYIEIVSNNLTGAQIEDLKAEVKDNLILQSLYEACNDFGGIGVLFKGEVASEK